MSSVGMAQKFKNALSVTVFYGVTLVAFVHVAMRYFPTPPTAMALDTSKKSMPGLSFDPQPLSDAPLVQGVPIRLVISSLQLDRRVEPGIYDTASKDWYVSPKGIHFATPSSLTNNLGGSTLLYGHNNRQVFGPLKRLQPGDTAVVTTDSGHVFTYRYQGTSDHQPTDTSVFGYAGQPQLILQTCSGLFNEIRTFYTFRLESYQPA